MTRRLGSLAVLALLAGCVVDPATGERSLGQLITRADELAIGREEHPRILRQFGSAYGDARIATYLDAIGQPLAQLSETPEVAFTFTVLNSPIVNAFALPGGYVYVTRGLLALAGSEAELASVLAHEIGHVAARHAALRHRRTAQAGGVQASGAQAGAAPGSAMNEPGQDPAAYAQSFSQEQEMEADTLGIRLLARAGYETKAMSSFLARLDAHAALEAKLMALEADQMSFTTTHPRNAERVQAAAQLAAAGSATGAAAGAQGGRGGDPESYLKQIDGLLYGDDPEQGFVRGAAFLHPGLRIRFEAPPGFRLFNSATRVTARGPNGAMILFEHVRPGVGSRADARASIAEYLTDVWSRDTKLTDPEPLTINGFAAATGWARVDTNRGPRDMRLLAIQFDSETIYRFTFITPPAVTQSLAEDMRRAAFSFRTLSAEEAAALKPLRLRFVSVREGETVQELADQMPAMAERTARFRVLNGLGPEGELKTGQAVKSIVEQP